MRTIILASFFLLLSSSAFPQDSSPIKTEVLLQSTSTWDSTLFQPYPEGQPEITISRITIQPGAQLPVHTHPNPLGGVILSGELTVYKEDGTSHTFQSGDPILEVVNTKHYGKNTGEEPTVLIAFYIGVVDVPLTILDQ